VQTLPGRLPQLLRRASRLIHCNALPIAGRFRFYSQVTRMTKPNPSIVQLAIAVCEIAANQESSFDHEEAERLKAKYAHADFSTCYKLTLEQAVAEYGGEYARPAYLILFGSWNDGLEWAEGVVKAANLTEAKIVENQHKRWVVVNMQGDSIKGVPVFLDRQSALNWAEANSYLITASNPRPQPRKLHKKG